MANAKGSSRPSAIAKWFADTIASSLNMSRTNIVFATQDNGDRLTFTGHRKILIDFSGVVPGSTPNAGPGRVNFPVSRQVYVHVITRRNTDVAGTDEKALADNWDLQDEIINAIMLVPQNPPLLLALPPKLVGGDAVNNRGLNIKNPSPGVYEGILVFEVHYVTVTNTAVAGGALDAPTSPS